MLRPDALQMLMKKSQALWRLTHFAGSHQREIMIYCYLK
jgi:hypothetical protein